MIETLLRSDDIARALDVAGYAVVPRFIDEPQARAIRGDFVFPNDVRPTTSASRRTSRIAVRHGVSRVTRGERHALGLIFTTHPNFANDVRAGTHAVAQGSLVTRVTAGRDALLLRSRTHDTRAPRANR